MSIEITPSTLEDYIKEVAIPLNSPTVIWGAPGVGKTDIVTQAAAAAGYHCHSIYLPMFEIWDLVGLPVPNAKTGKTDYYPPESIYPNGEKVLLFLDEIAQCSTSMQSMASRIVYERQLGDFKLPDDWIVVLAGNRQEDKAGTTRISSHINNRVTHLNLIVSTEDWTRWALTNDIDIRAIKFIQMREEMLNTFNPDEKINATPRTWEKVSDVIKHVSDKRLLHPTLAGLLGEEVGTAFYGFLDIFENMVDINQIIMNPDLTEVPDDPSTRFAISAALVSKANEENIGRIMKYAARMGDEFEMRTVIDMAQRHKWLTNTREYTQWGINHADLHLAKAA